MKQDIDTSIFERFISAKRIMERWGMDHIQLRQIPIHAFIQTKKVDCTALNPLSPHCGSKPGLFNGLKQVSPITKEHFEEVSYDFYTLVQYELKHPEIVKDRSVCPQLEEDFCRYHPEILNEPLLQKKSVTIPTPKGTTWEQIKIRIVNKEHIEITVCNEMAPYSDRDLGLASKRTLWPLLEQIAAYRGDFKPKDYGAIKANISNLRNHLKNIFPGIDGNPIKNYDPINGYVCNFQIMDSSTR